MLRTCLAEMFQGLVAESGHMTGAGRSVSEMLNTAITATHYEKK
jgi:hypothetical protein